MSESNKSTISDIFKRWTAIDCHLIEMANSPRFFADDLHEYLTYRPDKICWESRYKRQVQPIHQIAYYLKPQHTKYAIDENTMKQILDFFQEYLPDDTQVVKHFLDFQSHRNIFDDGSLGWERWSNDTSTFWSYYALKCPSLANLADQLMTTIANSVPSERAFSAMGYVHSVFRNRLSLEKANMLQYIYINRRSLRKLETPSASEEEELAEEDRYLQMLGELEKV